MKDRMVQVPGSDKRQNQTKGKNTIMSEKERVKETRKRNLKRAVFMGAILLLFVRRVLRKRRKHAAEIIRKAEMNGLG